MRGDYIYTARGYGDLDWTALALVAEEEAGLYAIRSLTPD